MAETFQTFEFVTKKIPQAPGADGSHWEKVPLASFPPVFDISIPDSTANAVASAMSNIAASFSGLNNTLQSVTQSLQQASCSIGDLIDSLKNAQLFADEFAKQNNGTKIYVRQIGLDPVGTVNSQQTFIARVRSIMIDTGSEVGKIPKIVPAEIPLEPSLIANALGSGQSLLDNAIGGSTQLGGFVGGALSQVGISASAGLGLKELSNDINFQPVSEGGGFSSSTISYNVLAITKIDSTTAEATIETKNSVQQNFVIQGANSSSNNGSFTVQPNGVIQVTSLGKTLTRVRYQNPIAVVETTTKAQISFLGIAKVSASDTIRGALEQEKLFGPDAVKKTLPVTDLLNILVKYNIVGVNPDQLEEDKSIALERLTRLITASSQRVGGILLVGRAPNLPSLARKVQGLAQMMEFLKPLADRLAFSAIAASSPNASGVDYDPTNVDLNKLQSQDNVAKKDAEAAKKKAEESGALDHEMIPLETVKENPPPNNFNAWYNFTPVQLIPGLATLGELEQDALTQIQSPVAAVVNATTGNLASLIQDGKDALDTGLQKLTSQGNAVDSLVAEMNALNDKMVSGLNFLKNQIGVGPISLDGHLIGAKLNLQSNEQFVEAVETTLSDATDPNRPTFGPPPSSSVLENQNTLQAALQGTAPPTTNTRLWFGIVLVIVGKDRKDLGNQMRTLAGLLSMDDSAVDLPPKPKLSFSGLSV